MPLVSMTWEFSSEPIQFLGWGEWKHPSNRDKAQIIDNEKLSFPLLVFIHSEYQKYNQTKKKKEENSKY